MYNLNKQKLDEILTYFEELLQQGELLNKQWKQDNLSEQEKFLLHHASERVLQLFFEMFTDVANLLIDGFIMRDPGSYEDMVDILEDEQVIHSATGAILRDTIAFNRRAGKEYLSLTFKDVQFAFTNIYPKIGELPEQVKAFVQAELP